MSDKHTIGALSELWSNMTNEQIMEEVKAAASGIRMPLSFQDWYAAGESEKSSMYEEFPLPGGDVRKTKQTRFTWNTRWSPVVDPSKEVIDGECEVVPLESEKRALVIKE